MNRRGTSLIEMLVVIGVLLPTAGAALAMAARLGSGAPPADGRLADLVCLQLRRDAAGGAACAGDALRAGTRSWRLEDGWLCREGVQRLRVDAAFWRADGRLITVDLLPTGLPPRRLELEAKP